jgi:hypothetical protein
MISLKCYFGELVLNLKRYQANNNKKNSTNTAILGSISLSAAALAVFLFSVGMTEAETGIGSDIFKVVLTIIGADKAKTGDVVAIVTVNDHAKVKFFELKSPDLISNPSNTSEPSSSKETTDEKIIEYVATFPNVTVNSGDSYNACVLPLKSLKIVCSEGHNSPAKRPEFVDISLGSDKSERSSPPPDESTITNQSAVLSSGFDITDEKQHKKK